VNSFAFFGLLFFIVPMLEIYTLIKVGSVIGALWTIGLVVLTAVVGAALLRAQGLATLQRAQTALHAGTLPATELMEGLALLVGGALLLTPGFITDAFGFVCLLPITRRPLVKFALARFLAVQASAGGPSDSAGPQTLEGEFRRED
jgi:UPF0716 protein FxsA